MQRILKMFGLIMSIFGFGVVAFLYFDNTKLLEPILYSLAFAVLGLLLLILSIRLPQIQAYLENLKKERSPKIESVQESETEKSDALAKYLELLKGGGITQEEYDAKKKELLLVSNPHTKYDKKLISGVLGSALLIIGVFLPIFKVAILGNINYFQNGKGDGIILLILAVVSLVLIFTKIYKGLWATGLGSLGLLAYTFIGIQSKFSQGKAEMASSLANNPFGGMAKAMMDGAFQWQLGLPIMVIGAVLLIASAVIKE
jgi:hypothetical protein